ncbi:MAG: molybdopterin-dependent oxidoreductase [Bacteroidota bacterium]|nr:molybdopterin-dependent oxidoreductase [Bacteroidota bacterium]
MKNYDLVRHVKGESKFVDDILTPEGCLHAYVLYSQIAHGNIKSVNINTALQMEGVEGIFIAKDIPGENQIGGIIQDEELLASCKVDFIGQPIAIVVAKTVALAKEASKKIIVDIEELTPVIDPRVAFEKGELIMPPRVFSLGDVEANWDKCALIVEGTVESGGQEHLYLETQGAFACPVEGGGVKIVSSTQSPTTVQKTAAKVLGLKMHLIEVDVLRLGGGFGGKEDQASQWAAMAAMAALKLNKPVKLILPRQDDLRMTGKRHPYSSDYKIGLNKEGKIINYEVTFYQNAGASADLSPAILDRTLFHCTNSYFVPNVKATACSCKTNLPPNTAFRGFGGPQGMFVIEAAIYKAAEKLGIDPCLIQEKNLLAEGDEFSYGQKAEQCMAKASWESAISKFNFPHLKKEIDEFNVASKIVKKGIALMPICFGISFTTTFLNQASALVHVYSDGSVGVSTGAIEMGQGVNMKIRQVVASVFSIKIDRIKNETTNTTRNANTSATAASSGADLNGKAAQLACNNILNRLKDAAAKYLSLANSDQIEIKDEVIYYENKPTRLLWNELISSAYMQRVSLSSHAYYAPPGIYFDKDKAKGKPFAYHVYGTAIIQVAVDCLKGVYEIESVKIVHDFGKSINKAIDRSQTEGAVMQGIGWMTMEELKYNENGRLLTDALSTYKVPDIYFAPKEFEVEFLDNPNDSLAVFNSKAIGEPPFMYGIGAYFAIMNAMKSYKPEKHFEIISPMTPERLLLSLYN